MVLPHPYYTNSHSAEITEFPYAKGYTEAPQKSGGNAGYAERGRPSQRQFDNESNPAAEWLGWLAFILPLYLLIVWAGWRGQDYLRKVSQRAEDDYYKSH